MLYDLSEKFDLLHLAEVINPLQAQAARLDAQFFLMGAAARDVMLLHVHGIDTKRKTEDVDFGVMVKDWATFDSLRESLVATGEFKAVSKDATHKLWHKSGRPLDIVPFGGVERADRTLAWPPDEHMVFDCFGMREAMQTSHQVLLPKNTVVNVASIPALALLKITAWQDRKLTHPGRDAGDLMHYLRHYLDCGNLDRATTEHADLFAGEDPDYEENSARLLGRDLLELIDKTGLRRLLEILRPEADDEGNLLLVMQSGISPDRGRRIIQALFTEISKHI